MKMVWGAPQRNQDPILTVLKRVLPETGTALEVASGSGQHAAYFAGALPGWRWQPSDIDPRNLASIEAYVAEAGLPNLPRPITLDVTTSSWLSTPVDLVFCANMIHIAPWECTGGLVVGAGRHLVPGGRLVTYGPYRIGGRHTAPSNAAFHESLRGRDARWGVRDLEAVVALAEDVGLRLVERIEMPANNQTVVFTKTESGA